jgi:hypothetical protein
MLVNKLLWKNNKKIHFIGAFLGSLLGFILLLVSIQLYIDFKNILFSGEKLLQPEYLVINKKVSFFKAFESGSLSFSAEEIKQIQSQAFVKDAAPFVANNFKVSAYTKETNNIPAFYTELFFESVQDKYLDIDKSEWKWSTESPFVPVIIPKEYLNLYNFGFSESQGLPKVSEGMAGMVTFILQLKGNGMVKELPAKIIGFSNRINTILVPYNFMEWANSTLGNNVNPEPQRLIVVTENSSDPKIVEFLNKLNYETNTEKLKNSKAMVILNIITTVVSGIALLIVFLSFMNFILGFQLLIFRSSDKIKLLLQLGYKHTKIRNLYASYYLAGMAIIGSLAIASVYLIKQQFSTYLNSIRMADSGIIHWQVLITALGMIFLLILINFLTLHQQLKMVENK